MRNGIILLDYAVNSTVHLENAKGSSKPARYQSRRKVMTFAGRSCLSLALLGTQCSQGSNDGKHRTHFPEAAHLRQRS